VRTQATIIIALLALTALPYPYSQPLKAAAYTSGCNATILSENFTAGVAQIKVRVSCEKPILSLKVYYGGILLYSRNVNRSENSVTIVIAPAPPSGTLSLLVSTSTGEELVVINVSRWDHWVKPHVNESEALRKVKEIAEAYRKAFEEANMSILMQYMKGEGQVNSTIPVEITGGVNEGKVERDRSRLSLLDYLYASLAVVAALYLLAYYLRGLRRA